jgi:indolepyruvate ferredoxin oxidoreductase beta subunit
MVAAKPIKILIAALGGEGGGVLTSWLHAAAMTSGHFVQSTYIPGVAQRTGATTYYLEVVPGAGSSHDAAGRRPVLALDAAPGEVDVVVASELLECSRAIRAGFVTPARTFLIASSARVFTIEEKAAAGDGRLDTRRMREAADRFSRRALIADFAAVARQSRAPLGAVLLGAISASRALPIDAAAMRAAIRQEGKAVEANLAGFEAGLAAGSIAQGSQSPAAAAAAPASPEPQALPLRDFPPEAREVLCEGVRRLSDYQDAGYAQTYLERVRVRALHPGADGPFVAELARQLALRMSLEDVIRVAQLKLRAARLRRLRSEVAAGSGEVVHVFEYMKPGPEEILGLLPPGLGRWARRHVRGDRFLTLKIRTTGVSGFLRLRLLAALRGWRRRTLRFAEEEAWVDRWLSLLDRTLAVDPAAAREVAAAAGLVRGYADTYQRGITNYARIVEGVVEPMLRGGLARPQFADAVLQARLAASKDPEGAALAETIAAIHRTAGAGSRAQPGTSA